MAGWFEAYGAVADDVEDGSACMLELGSGTGWLGLTVARNVDSIGHMRLTDMAHAIPALSERATSWSDGFSAEVDAVPLDWADVARRCGEPGTDFAPPKGYQRWNVVFGSDLIWTAYTARLLPWTLRAALLSGSAARVLYGHWDRQFDKVYEVLWEECRKAGLVLTKLPGVSDAEVKTDNISEEARDNLEASVVERRRQRRERRSSTRRNGARPGV